MIGGHSALLPLKRRQTGRRCASLVPDGGCKLSLFVATTVSLENALFRRRHHGISTVHRVMQLYADACLDARPSSSSYALEASMLSRACLRASFPALNIQARWLRLI